MPGIERDEQLMSVAMMIFQDPDFLAKRTETSGNERPLLWDARAATFEAMFQLGMYDETMGFAQTPDEAHAMQFISRKLLELTQ